ncbi:MAG: TraB/GumN family protein [Chitinophagaceae bacterium]
MKRLPVLLLITLVPYLLHAQPPVKKKKYPSLLWEISGNGLKKPSFLFGTMHVSSKMAFHLSDSFYLGLRNADVVALETNPESWQEDMSKYETGTGYGNNYSRSFSGYFSMPTDYLTLSTLKFYKYDKKVERTLYSNPSTINNLLYRTYGNDASDFEEDTYLDMYIYQCGKKWGKKVAGVEKYGESMKLMMEAYKDAAKDKNRKERSYDAEDGFSSGNLQEAYRTGNLDWLDSINRYNSFSSAFDEKFLYRRNEIQAASIDSILKTGHSLFVGVGAAHLPGTRGVIEMLRAMGYRLRPVRMGERDSQHKNQVEKLRVPVTFTTQPAEDGIYKVDIPGKFYKFGDDAWLDQRQYADMANGSYYMVTRIMTNAWMWGHTTDKVYRVIDSLLYENVPGKIVTRAAIVRNGYRGIDLTNKTRRGDLQRYNIFITPFEILVFKMSGTGDYVKNGDEARRFFGSIQLREFTPAPVAGQPAAARPAERKKYNPPDCGVSVN